MKKIKFKNNGTYFKYIQKNKEKINIIRVVTSFKENYQVSLLYENKV